jgi:hypothetical protein
LSVVKKHGAWGKPATDTRKLAAYSDDPEERISVFCQLPVARCRL